MQAAASISQDMTDLKQASARIADVEGSLLSGELSGHPPKIFITTVTVVSPPHSPKWLQYHLIYICLSSFVVV